MPEPRYCVGIDGGSTFCKAVLLERDMLLAKRAEKSGWRPAAVAGDLLAELLDQTRVRREDCTVVTTGYSRESIEFSDASITEITAHGRGALLLAPGIGGVVDIGGQDSKTIRLENGRVTEFQMNDKCAAGTGRFVEMACRSLGLSAGEVDRVCRLEDAASINSMCAVFAESEIIGLIAAGVDRGRIIGGVMLSVAARVAQMLRKTDLAGDRPLLMTGGLSGYACLLRAISEASGRQVSAHPDSLYAGAIGAALSVQVQGGSAR